MRDASRRREQAAEFFRSLLVPRRREFAGLEPEPIAKLQLAFSRHDFKLPDATALSYGTCSYRVTCRIISAYYGTSSGECATHRRLWRAIRQPVGLAKVPSSSGMAQRDNLPASSPVIAHRPWEEIAAVDTALA